MPFNFDRVFGVHAPALQLRAQRAEMLASNLANADTPGFKARDIDFSRALEQAKVGTELQATRPGHISGTHTTGRAETLYRVPSQPSLDGNTVDTQVEQSRFAENAMRYQATLRFLNGKIDGIQKALKGE